MHGGCYNRDRCNGRGQSKNVIVDWVETLKKTSKLCTQVKQPQTLENVTHGHCCPLWFRNEG